MKKFLMIPALSMCLSLFGADQTIEKREPQVGEIVWNELGTPNVQSAKDFYGKTFGWEFVDMNMGDMNYTMIKKGNKEVGGIWGIPPAIQNQVPPHWIAYIYVENVEQSLEKARKNGATVIKPVQKAGDIGLFAIIKDPTGAHIALWQPLKK